MSANIKVVSLFLFLSLVSITSAATYYVSVDGNDLNDGLSWETAFETIQHGIDTVADYDVIEVNEGTYYESLYMDSLPPYYSSEHVTIQSVDPNDWNVVSATVIDGNGVSNTIFAGFGTYPTFSGLTITGGNRGIYAGYPGSITVSNCIITNNNSVGAYFYSCSNAAVNNCIIKDNTIEGIYLEAVGSCDLKNTLIHNNDQGIRSYGPVSADIYNCTIVDNSSYGIKGAEFAELDIKNCIIWENNDDLYDCNAIYSCISDGDAGTGNISTDPCFVDSDSNDFHLLAASSCINVGDPNGDYDGQADIDNEIRVFGNGIDMGADETSPRVHNYTQDSWYLTINEALEDANDGDTIVIYPGIYYEAINLDEKGVTLKSTDPNNWETVESTIIDGSSADSTFVLDYSSYMDRINLVGLTITGGTRGVYCTGGYPILKNCITRDNGTGIEVYNSVPYVDNCIIKDNTNEGISVGSCSAYFKNCLMSGNDTGFKVDAYCGPSLKNCTIVNNTSYGVRKVSPYCSVSLLNCVLWNNGDDIDGNEYISANFSCIEDGYAGTGNISSDPCFVDADSNDFCLQPNSPCIDDGNNVYVDLTVDIAGNNRKIDGDGDGTATVDMGAYEYGAVFRVLEESSDNSVAIFDNNGNLFLKGTLLTDQNSIAASADVNEFRIWNSGNDDIALINQSDGNMYITGVKNEKQSSIIASENVDEFIIKNSAGHIVSDINDSGQLYLKGWVFQNYLE